MLLTCLQSSAYANGSQHCEIVLWDCVRVAVETVWELLWLSVRVAVRPMSLHHLARRGLSGSGRLGFMGGTPAVAMPSVFFVFSFMIGYYNRYLVCCNVLWEKRPTVAVVKSTLQSRYSTAAVLYSRTYVLYSSILRSGVLHGTIRRRKYAKTQ